MATTKKTRRMEVAVSDATDPKTTEPTVDKPKKTTKAKAAATETPEAITATPAPKGKRGGRKAAESKTKTTTDEVRPQPDDGNEVVVFAFRLSRSERDEIHAATGSAKASRFVKAIALAGARGDMKAMQEIVEEVHTSRQ